MSDAQSISSHLKELRRFEPPKEFAARARIGSRAEYDELYRESIDSPETFWRRETSSLVWRKPWT
ncbi:MAG TPA: acetyl-coenzyme A synthetase N-terminal domain-containing protein, partial [Polyangiaceae bacterium]|nr:acetyl-coenzyme A synthetase N-terminal domain-containing protein [Polyangiaceae bacterium]